MADELAPREADRLRQVLRRQQAPPDLADRVLARINSGGAEQTSAAGLARNSMVVRWFAAAAAVLVMAGVGQRYYEQQRDAAEAARVQQEIRLALEITSRKLALVQRKMQESAERR